MVKVLVYSDCRRAEQGISHYDNLNRRVLRKIVDGYEYYSSIELCHDKAGYFFGGDLFGNVGRSYESIDSLVSAIKSSLPANYPGTKMAVVPVFYTVKNHACINKSLACDLSGSSSEVLASCCGLKWLERRRFENSYSLLSCF